MSFTEKKFVAIHCDECDEQYDPEDGSAYYTDKDDADVDILPRMNAGDSRILRFGFLFATTKQERRGR